LGLPNKNKGLGGLLGPCSFLEHHSQHYTQHFAGKLVIERFSPWRTSRYHRQTISRRLLSPSRPTWLSYPAHAKPSPRFDAPASPPRRAKPAQPPLPSTDVCHPATVIANSDPPVTPPPALTPDRKAPPIGADHFLDLGVGHGALGGREAGGVAGGRV